MAVVNGTQPQMAMANPRTSTGPNVEAEKGRAKTRDNWILAPSSEETPRLERGGRKVS